MGEKKPHYKQSSRAVLVLKAVITGLGHSVSRDYKIDNLQKGDIGIHIRLDRGLANEPLTPEQRTTMHEVAKEMTTDFLASIGVEEKKVAPGIKPGMVVRVGKVRGEVVSVGDNIITLRCLRLVTWKPYLIDIPRARYTVRILPGRGLESVAMYHVLSIQRDGGCGDVVRLIGFIHSQKKLVRIANEAKHPTIKSAVAKKMADQAGLPPNLYDITVECSKSLKEMVAAGHYDHSDGDVAEHFPIKGEKGVLEVKTQLVRLYRHEYRSNPDIADELGKRGLRPASVEELLAFGTKYPDLQRQFKICALGSVWFRPVEQWLLDDLAKERFMRDCALRWGEDHGWDANKLAYLEQSYRGGPTPMVAYLDEYDGKRRLMKTATVSVGISDSDDIRFLAVVLSATSSSQ